MSLTGCQQQALAAILSGANVLITGGGGVGKSYVVKKAIEELESRGRQVIVTASTGKAALLLGGATAHSAFKIPIHQVWAEHPTVTKKSAIYSADTVVIDEVSMIRMDVMQYILEAAQQVPSLQVVLVGDFAQLPPVLVRDNKKRQRADGREIVDEAEAMSLEYGVEDVGNAFGFQAPLWRAFNFQVCILDEVVRQKDRGFIDALNRIRMGDPDGSGRRYITENSRRRDFPAKAIGVIALCGTNKAADKINEKELEKLKGDETVFAGYDEGPKRLAEKDKPVPGQLRLRKNCQVMICVNDPETDEAGKKLDRYRNGSTGIVTGMYLADSIKDSYIKVKLASTGETVEVDCYTWQTVEYIKTEELDQKTGKMKKIVKPDVVNEYHQIPVRLGYAITIHKSQGATYDKVRLEPKIFAFGQLYTALSRATSLTGLYINGDITKVDKLAAPEVISFYQHCDCSEQKDTSPKPMEKRKAQVNTKKKKNRVIVSCPDKAMDFLLLCVKAKHLDATPAGKGKISCVDTETANVVRLLIGSLR